MTEATRANYLLGLYAVTEREVLKFVRQRERLISAIVRPSLWLFIFATGLQNLLGISIIEPYETYTPYQEYILPGLCGIIVLFQCMQSALSMVYDREAGVMRVMLVSPLPRSFLLFAKILGATILAAGQIYVFLGLAAVFGFYMTAWGMFYILPAIFLTGLMLGSIGLLISVYARQIENFAGMMNFVIFPMFFMSSALYPLWKLRESGAEALFWIASFNPFTHGVELIRFAAYGQFNALSALVVAGVALAAFALAAWGYDPSRGAIGRIKRG
ncbi:ABC transporter permease [Maritimibacter sp. DP07]|uniref:Transport permease protein n=1 Tax=Maritimibacter harenae TaxID=2606218 RepID=A0A845M772_9RHOB|nr:ABC transporter permease [Maritimibacter harenae]MZR14949.1 ABC transporter permease [Maritimibacter harenae]